MIIIYNLLSSSEIVQENSNKEYTKYINEKEKNEGDRNWKTFTLNVDYIVNDVHVKS